MMKRQYSKRQISETIAYWRHQLIVKEAVDEVVGLLKEYRMLNESKEEDLKDKAEEVSKNVKDQSSLIKFLKKNRSKVEEKASKMEEEDKSVFLSIWNKLCICVLKGASFILSNIVEIMKLVVLIVLAFFGYKLYRKFAGMKEDQEKENKESIANSEELIKKNNKLAEDVKEQLKNTLDLDKQNDIERPEESINPQDGSPVQLSLKDRDRIVKYLNRNRGDDNSALDPLEKWIDNMMFSNDVTFDKVINSANRSILTATTASDLMYVKNALVGAGTGLNLHRNPKAFDNLMGLVSDWEKDPKSFEATSKRNTTTEILLKGMWIAAPVPCIVGTVVGSYMAH